MSDPTNDELPQSLSKKEAVFNSIRNLLDPYLTALDAAFPTEDALSIEKGSSGLPKTIPVVKQFNDEQMISVEPLYCGPMQGDAHGDAMTEEEVRKMVDDFNRNISKISGNIGHLINTEGFKPIKAWVNEVDCMIGENFVAEGTPIVKLQFTDPDLWSLRKEGKLLGVSIGARGVRKEV